jgi:hypothetical protein
MCREIVLVDRTPERANGVATDRSDPQGRLRLPDVQAMVVGEYGTSEVLLWSSASVGRILGSGSQPDATRITAVGIAGNCRPQSQSRRLKSRYRPPDRITISAVEVNTPRGLPNPG